MKRSEEIHNSNLKQFGVMILVLEVIIIVLYGVFVRFYVHSGDNENVIRYPAYQDVNVMMLIGFGFLMTFIKSHSWSALSYTFFINAIIVQLYILLSGFWYRVFTSFQENYITIKQITFTQASYCVASTLIAFGAVLGRVGPRELLVMGLFQIVGYTLNERITYTVFKASDVGGSMVIHTFGAYFGLTVSLIIGRFVKPTTKAQSNKNSNIFAMIGTLFLWMYWPSFNFGVFSVTEYQKTQVIGNTIISLTGSCLATFMMGAFLKNKFAMEDILNATLAGGVVIGAPAAILYHPGAALTIGFCTGVVSTLANRFLTAKLQEAIGLYDTCGVHNLHGIPGILGGLFSGIAFAAYNSPLTFDSTIASNTYVTVLQTVAGGSYFQQGGIQIAATFISLGIAIVFGIVAGFVIRCFYNFEANEFYLDEIYFEDAEEVELNKDHQKDHQDKSLDKLESVMHIA